MTASPGSTNEPTAGRFCTQTKSPPAKRIIGILAAVQEACLGTAERRCVADGRLRSKKYNQEAASIRRRAPDRRPALT